MSDPEIYSPGLEGVISGETAISTVETPSRGHEQLPRIAARPNSQLASDDCRCQTHPFSHLFRSASYRPSPQWNATVTVANTSHRCRTS